MWPLGEERANLSAFSYVCSVCASLDLSVSSSAWGLGRAAVCDCGTPWTFLLPFLHTTPVVFVPCGDPRKSPRTFPLMVLLFQVPEFALYNHLSYSSSS